MFIYCRLRPHLYFRLCRFVDIFIRYGFEPIVVFVVPDNFQIWILLKIKAMMSNTITVKAYFCSTSVSFREATKKSSTNGKAIKALPFPYRATGTFFVALKKSFFTDSLTTILAWPSAEELYCDFPYQSYQSCKNLVGNSGNPKMKGWQSYEP